MVDVALDGGLAPIAPVDHVVRSRIRSSLDLQLAIVKKILEDLFAPVSACKAKTRRILLERRKTEVETECLRLHPVAIRSGREYLIHQEFRDPLEGVQTSAIGLDQAYRVGKLSHRSRTSTEHCYPLLVLAGCRRL